MFRIIVPAFQQDADHLISNPTGWIGAKWAKWLHFYTCNSCKRCNDAQSCASASGALVCGSVQTAFPLWAGGVEAHPDGL